MIWLLILVMLTGAGLGAWWGYYETAVLLAKEEEARLGRVPVLGGVLMEKGGAITLSGRAIASTRGLKIWYQRIPNEDKYTIMLSPACPGIGWEELR